MQHDVNSYFWPISQINLCNMTCSMVGDTWEWHQQTLTRPGCSQGTCAASPPCYSKVGSKNTFNIYL